MINQNQTAANDDSLDGAEPRDMSLFSVLILCAAVACFLLVTLGVSQSAEFAAAYETCVAAGGDTLTCSAENGSY